MSSILGIDVGERRVGVAISLDGGPASPIGAFARAKGAAERELIRLIQERGVTTVVLGMPYGANGERNVACDAVENFGRRLLRRANVVLAYADEFLSSEDAKQRLGIQGSPHREIRESGEIDAVSASIILQTYLDTM